MAKRSKSNRSETIFLIMRSQEERGAIAEELRENGSEVHEYMTGREFLVDKRNYSGGVVAADFRLLDMPGPDLIEVLQGDGDAFTVLLIVGHRDTPDAIRTGCNLVTKPLTAQKIQETIDTIQGTVSLSEDFLDKAFCRLTGKETEILNLISSGHGSREIAQKLGVVAKTIEAHRANILAKTRATDTADLVRLWKSYQTYQT